MCIHLMSVPMVVVGNLRVFFSTPGVRSPAAFRPVCATVIDECETVLVPFRPAITGKGARS